MIFIHTSETLPIKRDNRLQRLVARTSHRLCFGSFLILRINDSYLRLPALARNSRNVRYLIAPPRPRSQAGIAIGKSRTIHFGLPENPEGKMLPYMTFRTPGDSVINTGGFRRRTTLLPYGPHTTHHRGNKCRSCAKSVKNIRHLISMS